MRPIIHIAFTIAFAGFSFASRSDAPIAFDDLVKEGRAAFLASDLDRAGSAYDRACPADSLGSLPVARAVMCENLLASVDEARGNLARAEQRYLHAVTSADQAGSAYRPLYCARLIDLGEHYRRQGQFSLAEATLVKALEIARQVVNAKPDLLHEALIRLGGLYSRSAQPERGRAPLTEALTSANPDEDTQTAALPTTVPPTEVAYARDSMGIIELAAGNLNAAEAELRASADLAARTVGEDHPVTARYQTDLALALLVRGRYSAADLLLRRVRFVMESQPRPSLSELAAVFSELSAANAGEGKMAQAEEFAQHAITLLERLPQRDERVLAMAQITLAAARIGAHDAAAAELVLPGAVAALRTMPANPNTVASAVALLGRLREQQQNWRAAEALYREALDIYAKQGSGDSSPVVVPILRALANTLRHERASKQEIRELEARARNILRASANPPPRG